MNLLQIIEFTIYSFIGLIFTLWAFWTWKTFKKKRAGLLIFQLLVFFGGLFWFTWSMRIFPGSQAYYDRHYNQQLTGMKFSPDLTYEYETSRAFNGDGYSIRVYDIDSKTAKLLQSPQNKFFTDYPIKPDFRSNWQQKKWDRTPLKAGEQIFLDFGLNEYTPNDPVKAKKLEETFRYIEKILSESGSFYAFNFYMHRKDYVGNIDFYILSPSEKKLIVINHNT